jgi:hypothetical protein
MKAMVDLRKETLARIGVTQLELDGMRTALARLDELCRDLSDVGQALEKLRGPVSANGSPTVADLELIRLERELECDVRRCLEIAARTRLNGS